MCFPRKIDGTNLAPCTVDPDPSSALSNGLLDFRSNMNASAPSTASQTPITRILHPTDFSPTSARAFDYAVMLARLSGAELHLVHVVVPADEVQASESMLKRAVRDAEKRVETLARTLKEDVQIRSVVCVGSSHTEVISYALKEKIDLVVLGTVGLLGEASSALGSVAEKVIRGLNIPVLTVKLPRSPKAAATRRCTLCGAPVSDVICDACKDRVRGEAVDRRMR